MNRIRHLAIIIALSLVSATAGFAQPIPASAIPAPMPAVVVPADPAPVEATIESLILKGEPVVPKQGDDELRKLLIARYNAAVSEIKAVEAIYKVGATDFGNIYRSAGRVHAAAMELLDKPEDQIALLKIKLENAKHSEAWVKSRYIYQSIGPDAMHRATYLRLDTEIELLRAKRKAGLAK